MQTDEPISGGDAIDHRRQGVRAFSVTNRTVWAITLPMTLAYATTPLLGLTDTAVIGRVGDAAALGGLVVGALIFDFVFAVCNFLRAGTTGLTAQAFGAGKPREIETVFLRAAVLSIGIGLGLILAEPLVRWLGLLAVSPDPEVVATASTYVFIRMFSAPFALTNYVILGNLLGQGRSVVTLGLQIVINGTNIALSVLFGLVLEWGITGVALGTICGEALGCFAGLFVIARGFDRAKLPSWSEIFDRAAYRQMLDVNRDIMIRTICLLAAFLLFTRLGAQFGTVVLAANGILMNIFMTGSYFLDGMATASEQLAGRAVGAKYRPAFDRVVRLTSLWGIAIGMGLGAMVLAFGPALVDFLTTDENVRGSAKLFLVFAAMTPVAGALAFIMDGIYIGATWSRTMRDMMVLSLVIFVPAAYGLSGAFDNLGLWIALQIFLGLRGFTLLAALPARRNATF